MPSQDIHPEIDLAFRPESYWDLADPVGSIVQNITGENRRRMARDFVTGHTPAELGDIDDSLLADSLGQDARLRLGAIHPSFLGGEFLPSCLPGEVEIARLVFDSTTRDVVSVRARRGRKSGRFRYRIVDEYDTRWEIRPASSRLPLTLGQLIRLIDSADGMPPAEPGKPFLQAIWDWQLEFQEPEACVEFVTVESEVYPELGDWYAMKGEEWLAAVRGREEAGDE